MDLTNQWEHIFTPVIFPVQYALNFVCKVKVLVTVLEYKQSIMLHGVAV